MMDPHGEKLEHVEELPQLSEDDLEKRIGVQAPPPRRARQSRPDRVRYVGTTRRRVLWRDSATILIGVVLALLAVRFLLPSASPTVVASPTPEDTGLVAVGSPTGTLFVPTPVPTVGPIVNPSLGLGATPTPIPVITLPPPTPTPKPTPTLKPGTTPKPTLKPGTTPTPAPTLAPVFADFSCSPATGTFSGSVTVTCLDKSSGATSWSWNFGDQTPIFVGQTPPPHTYSTAGTFQITLTVNGPGTMINPSASDCCWVVGP